MLSNVVVQVPPMSAAGAAAMAVVGARATVAAVRTVAAANRNAVDFMAGPSRVDRLHLSAEWRIRHPPGPALRYRPPAVPRRAPAYWLNRSTEWPPPEKRRPLLAVRSTSRAASKAASMASSSG